MEPQVVTESAYEALHPPVREVNRSASLRARLAEVRRLAAEGTPVALHLDPADGPVVSVATAAVEAGATVLVLPGPASEEDAAPIALEREVRRAADVTAALVAARGAVR